MSLWSRVMEWFVRDGQHLTKVVIPDPDGIEAIPNDSYLRVWLTDAFLKRDREWFRDHYPSVHGSVVMRYAGREGTEFTRTARPPEGMLGPGDRSDYVLTPLVPFNGGTVELESALTVVEGTSALSAALDVLQDFSKLVGPPLGDALGIAAGVSRGVERLLAAGAADIELGLHREFAAPGGGGDTTLRAGYYGLVKAPEGTFGKDAFTIADSKLHVRDGNASSPLTGRDYMVFYVEVRRERDDWRFRDIEELINAAKAAAGASDEIGWKAFGNAAITKAHTHPDLTAPDSRRVGGAIRRELLAARDGVIRAAPEPLRSLADIVDMRAISIEQAALSPKDLGEMLLD